MKRFIHFLRHTQLFAGIDEGEIESMLECLGTNVKEYKKYDYVVHQGEPISNIAILAEGQLLIYRDDYWGNSNIINSVEAGEMFGEAYATPNSGVVPNNVIAAKDSTVLFFDTKKIITNCTSDCRFHSMAVQNLIYAISDKNRKLVQKLGYMSNRTTREKLMSYLSDESNKQKSPTITIPFNRQQLADFLSVDRSAMSNELCKMRDDGLITFDKNKFTLLLN